MQNYKKSEGLYKKTESPIIESVEQTEGLYKKTKIASVNIANPDKKQQEMVNELEKSNTTKSRVLKE